MASRGAPSDFARAVAGNHRRMKGWIWAESEPCLSIAKEEVRRIRRNLEAVSASRAPPPPSEPDWWVLAVLLCPGDTTEAVAAWARQGRAPVADRIHFYLHPHTNPVEAFAAWYAAGHQDPRTAEVEDFATFHKQFGWDLNNQVYRDAVAKA
ncbi:MAG TPA: hypothetical protein VJ547_04740 [Candidatus Thermoplasmatota archaeon]|nr:hypothetical protein [Candidatus Thermoplasmatota archaeon]